MQGSEKWTVQTLARDAFSRYCAGGPVVLYIASVAPVPAAKGVVAMDGERFDSVVRGFARPRTRRGLLGRLAAASGALLVASTPLKVRAGFNCDYIGCGCATGTLHPCIDGLVCCASSPGTPGGAGVCSQPSDCDGSCNGTGGDCGASCNWGDNCPMCCSGWCGDLGSCA